MLLFWDTVGSGILVVVEMVLVVVVDVVAVLVVVLVVVLVLVEGKARDVPIGAEGEGINVALPSRLFCSRVGEAFERAWGESGCGATDKGDDDEEERGSWPAGTARRDRGDNDGRWGSGVLLAWGDNPAEPNSAAGDEGRWESEDGSPGRSCGAGGNCCWCCWCIWSDCCCGGGCCCC